MSTLVWKVFVVLLLGAQPGPAGQQADIGRYVSRPAPVQAELNVSELRRVLGRETEFFKTFVADGQDPAAAYDQSVAQIAKMLNTTTNDVDRAARSIRRLGFWLMAFGEEEESLRFLLIADCVDGQGALDGLLRGVSDSRHYSRMSYAGSVIHGFVERDAGVWMAEHRGKIALARDPVTVQEFLLRFAEAERNGTAPPADKLSLLRVRVDGAAMMNQAIPVGLAEDRDEFLMTVGLADLVACRDLTVTATAQGLRAVLRLDPNGRYAEALEGPAHRPILARALSEDVLTGGVVALKNPVVLGRAIRSAVTDSLAMAGGHDDGLEEFWARWRRETGLDLEQDVLANITEAGFLLPRPDDDSLILLLQARRAPQARDLITRLTGNLNGGRKVQPSTINGASVWEFGDGRIALVEKTVVVSDSDNKHLKPLLERLHAADAPLAEKLRRHHPDATGALVVNPQRIFPGGSALPGSLLVGLRCKDSAVVAESRMNLSSMAESASRGLGSAITRARRSARRAAAGGRLRQLAIMVIMYAGDHQQLPDGPDDLKAYAGQNKEVFLCPGSGKPFVYNASLGGKRPRDFDNPSKTVLFHDPPGVHPNGGNVAFLDGHVEWLEREDFERTIGQTERADGGRE